MVRRHRQEGQLRDHGCTWVTQPTIFIALLDSNLFLPESWSEDRPRCRAAHIPDHVVYRPKWQIALALYDRARANGVVVSLSDLR